MAEIRHRPQTPTKPQTRTNRQWGSRRDTLGHEDLEYAAKGLGKDGVGTGQEHVFREMDANISECFVNHAEDSDENCLNDTDLLIDLDIEVTADTAFLEPGIFQSIGTDIWSTDLRNMI